jgi:molybdate transport system substrate-binding protein
MLNLFRFQWSRSMNTLYAVALTALLTTFWSTVGAADVTVFAAASLTNAITDVARIYQAGHKIRIKLSFASSSTLAKQIEQSAPADLFISADTKWMDYLDAKGKIDHSSRRDLLGNTLVLIAPEGREFPVTWAKGYDFASAFRGKLCTGQVEAVPVGIYAKEALIHLGWWEAVKQRIVGTEDVRAALHLVERGECEAGIVYETDAKLSRKVAVLGAFPDNTHAPIIYPFALVTQSDDAKDFLRYLGEPPALDVFASHGFKILPRDRRP